MASEQMDLAMQIIRENFRGHAKSVYEQNGTIVVEMKESVLTGTLPEAVRGFPVRRVDPGAGAMAHASGGGGSTSTSAGGDAELEAARAELDRLRAQKRNPQRDAELEAMRQEIAALKGEPTH